MRLITVLLAGLLVLGAAAQAAAQMPTPVLKFDGAEYYQAGGKTWVRYKLRVVNWAGYAAALFDPAPNLPPCGSNPNSARAWVDVYDGRAPYDRLYGFCALAATDDLGKLWFAMEKGERPPPQVYITITDRRAKMSATSNRVAITAPAIIGPQVEPKRPKRLDDVFADIAKKVPAFAGAHVAQDMLVISLVETSPASVAAATDAVLTEFRRFGFKRQKTTTRQVKFPYQQLFRAREQAAQLVFSIPGVVLLDLDERGNRVRIGVDKEEVIPRVRQELGNAGIAQEVVAVEKVSPIERRFDQSLNGWVRPLTGGLRITGCTLSVVATRNGMRGLVTNSHCPGVQRSGSGVFPTFFQPETLDADKVVADKLVNAPLFTGGACPAGVTCRFSDSAWARLRPGVASYLGAIAVTNEGDPNQAFTEGIWNGTTIPTQRVREVLPFPLSGMVVARTGSTTGTTRGEVSDTCVDVTVGNITDLCQFRAEANSDPGDSGSPVFLDATDPITLVGILWGGPTDGSPSFVFSPLMSVAADLGMSPNDFLHRTSPPTVTIIEPTPGTVITSGASLWADYTYEAQITDPDGTSCFENASTPQRPHKCTVKWIAKQGQVEFEMGTGRKINFAFQTPGVTQVKVIATDSEGNAGQDSITINVTNQLPTTQIIQPPNGTTIHKGLAQPFQGTATDPGNPLSLPCENLTWTSSKSGDLPSWPGNRGCLKDFSFATVGQRTISLIARDQDGALSQPAQVTLNVIDPPASGPPIVKILSPGKNQAVLPGEEIVLKGSVKDPDGKSPIAVAWILKDSLQPSPVTIQSGIVQPPSDGAFIYSAPWVPSNDVLFKCGSNSVTVELRATDADGDPTSASENLIVLWGPC